MSPVLKDVLPQITLFLHILLYNKASGMTDSNSMLDSGLNVPGASPGSGATC